MSFSPGIHHRHTIRLKGYDYSSPGIYFVTVCTKDRLPILGHIEEGACVLSNCGRVVEAVWLALPRNNPDIGLDAYTIMPDHFHAIVHIPAPDTAVGAKHSLTLAYVNADNTDANASPRNVRPHGTTPGSLGAIIQSFKSVTSRHIHNVCNRTGTVWQRNYYEHIIRNEKELAAIRQYIEDNPK